MRTRECVFVLWEAMDTAMRVGTFRDVVFQNARVLQFGTENLQENHLLDVIN